MTVPRRLVIGGLAGLAWTFVSLVVGFALGAFFKRQEAQAALAEYREAIPKVFDRGLAAGRRLAEFELAGAADADQPTELLAVVDPERWAALMEARDKPMEN